MAEFVNLRESNRGNELHCEFKNFPVTFVNGLRRILLSDIPTVVIRDVQIKENTTQLPHEMLKHRMEMLPVNVHPTDAAAIGDAKIELRILPEGKTARDITTRDFAIQSGRETILMGDRESGDPLLFLRVRPSESVHMTGRLTVETKTASQVCTAATMWHTDPEKAKEDKRVFVEDNKGSPAVFDNFYIQRSNSRDENGRPNWIDMNVESVGVIPSKKLLQMAVSILRKQIDEYMKEAGANIERSKDNEYRVQIAQGGHTVCARIQEVIYYKMPVNFVSYDIPHPLRSDTIIRFNTSLDPNTVLENAKRIVEEYCAIVEKEL
jgi:DNA-directed RNA polymerase subunit L